MANREFRGIAVAQVTSECGDQIAAIALSYLVYSRSNSPFLAASTYAVTYVPWVFGSILLVAARRPARAPRRHGGVRSRPRGHDRGARLGHQGAPHADPGTDRAGVGLELLLGAVFGGPRGDPAGHLRGRPRLCRRGRDQPDPATGRLGVRLRAGRHHRGRGLALGRARDRLRHVCRVSCLVTLAAVRERPAVLVDGRPNLRSLFVDISAELQAGAGEQNPPRDVVAGCGRACCSSSRPRGWRSPTRENTAMARSRPGC